AIQRGQPTAVAACGDRYVLRAIDLIRHARRTDAPADLELPELVARLHVVCSQVAVHLAGEHEATGGRDRAVVVLTRIPLLPDDLVRPAVHRRDGAADACTKDRRAARARIALTGLVGAWVVQVGRQGAVFFHTEYEDVACRLVIRAGIEVR